VEASQEYLQSRSTGVSSENENRVIGLFPIRHLSFLVDNEDPEKIKVLFNTGHPTDHMRPVPAANSPSMDAKANLNSTREKGLPDPIPQNPPLLSTLHINSPFLHQDEIVESPVQEDLLPRIQFIDLPRPPQKQDNSEGTFPLNHDLIVVDPTDGLRGRRQKSGATPSSNDDVQPRLLRRLSTAVINNTFRRRTTEEESIRPVQRQVTLPYLTFSPTIRRNSVPPPSEPDANV